MSDDIDPKDWNARLKLAEKLVELGIECSMCGGTGGWPGHSGFVLCKPCNGAGTPTPTSDLPN